MAQSQRTHAGTRTIIETGDSVGVTIDVAALREHGFDPEELVGEEVHQKVEAGRVIIDLPERK